MQVSSFPLSASNVRKLKKQLTELKRQVKDDLPTEIEQSVGDRLKWQVIYNVPSDLRDLDGNYLGTTDAASSVNVEKGFKGHDVIWRGDQIIFIEFGTGASGAGQPYPGVMAPGYHPDPTKAWWVYTDLFMGNVLSRGLTPQAPMYNAAALARSERWLQTEAAKMLKARVTDALTIQ
jgi:hypothetical protein